MSREGVHSQLAAALDVVVHLVRTPGTGRRHVAEICVLERAPDGLVTAVPAVTVTPSGVFAPSEAAPALSRLLHPHWPLPW
ncbi:hypothetical protein [Actinomadura harenae]|uniref:hypothetical protein n=1 Tax=Actinomadura harenae TaxID=2483351 RepID=UPI0026B2F6ED